MFIKLAAAANRKSLCVTHTTARHIFQRNAFHSPCIAIENAICDASAFRQVGVTIVHVVQCAHINWIQRYRTVWLFILHMDGIVIFSENASIVWLVLIYTDAANVDFITRLNFTSLIRINLIFASVFFFFLFCSQLNRPALLWNLIINLQVRWTEFIKNDFLILLWSRVALFRVLIQDTDKRKKNESKYGILLENATFHRIYVCIIIIFFYFVRRLQSQTPRNSLTSGKWEGMPIDMHAI